VVLNSDTTITANASANLTVSGILSGGNALTTTGSGSVYLTNTNTYTGATAVTGGSLVLTAPGSLNAASVVTVGTSATGSGTATLTGTGTVHGNLTVQAGGVTGHLSPGLAGSGSLSVGGNLTLQANSVLDYNFGSSQLAMTGNSVTLTLPASGTVTLNNANSYAFTGSGSYELLSYVAGQTSFSGFTAGSDITSLFTLTNFTSSETYTVADNTASHGIFLSYSPAVTVTPTTYTLAATANGVSSLHLHSSDTATLATTLTNNGTSGYDSLTYTSLGSSANNGGTVNGAAAGGGTLTPGGNASNSTQTFSATTATTASYTITPSGGTIAGSTVPLGSPNTTTPASVNVYSGLSTWQTNGGGSWGTLPGTGAGAFGVNWDNGSPGVDSGFTNTDTATFGSAVTSGTASVTLDGASPSLQSLTFNNTAASYSIAQGTGGTLHLNHGSGTAAINVTGSHSITAPVALDSDTDVLTNNPTDTLAIAGNIGGSHALSSNSSSQGTVILSGLNTYSGGTNVNGGTVRLTQAQALPATGSLSVASGATLALAVGGSGQFTDEGGANPISNVLGANANIPATWTSGATLALHVGSAVGSFTYSGTLGSMGSSDSNLSLNKTGSGTLTLTHAPTYTGNTTVTKGTLVVPQLNTPGSTLTVQSGATAQLTPSGGTNLNASVLSSLNLDTGNTGTATGTLDLTDNGLIIPGAEYNATLMTNVVTWLTNAYDGGLWDMPGITSSVVAANSGVMTIAYDFAENLGNGSSFTWGNQTVNTGDLLLLPTIVGDVNMDGSVDSIDYGTLASNFGINTGMSWGTGDILGGAYNGDGSVDSIDYGAMAANFGITVSALEASEAPSLSLSPAAVTATPEPASLLLLTLGGLLLLPRRRRHHRA